MSRALLFISLVAGMTVASAANAGTIRVPTDALTINDALEAIDYNDGQPDVVEVAPGFYDEQVVPKGNAGVDSTMFPRAGSLSLNAIEAAVTSHSDPLTVRGSDPYSRAVIHTNTAAVIATYGMFPDNPADLFEASFVYCGKDITMENMELRHAPGVGSIYAKNGMAGNFVWQDCVFSNGTGELDGHEDFCDYNNNVELCSTHALGGNIGLDNDYTYRNCIIDGQSTVDGSFHDTAFVWWHGYHSDGDQLSAPVGQVTLENCILRNYDDLIHNFNNPSTAPDVGKGGVAAVTLVDCFGGNPSNVFRIRGAQPGVTLIRNVIDCSANPSAIFRFSDRSNRSAAQATIANNILVGGDPGVWIQCREAGGVFHVVNNTFYDYDGNAVQIDETAVNEINIANNIFAASEVLAASAVGVLITSIGPTVNVINNGYHNNGGGNVIGATTTNVGEIDGDPYFYGTTVNIRANPPTVVDDRVQEFVPGRSGYVDGGDTAAYAAAPCAGSLDVDSLNARYCGHITIGAQDAHGQKKGRSCLVVPGWDRY